MDNIQIRRNILEILYDLHNRNPNGAIEMDDLAQSLGLPYHIVSSNVKYLAGPHKQLVFLRKTSTGSSRIFSFVQITAAGIDLVDDPSEFNARFPTQVIHQHIAGSKFDVTIRDNASDVTVGTDIFKLRLETSDSVEEVWNQIMVSLGLHPKMDVFQSETYSRYEQGLDQLLARIDKQDRTYQNALVYQQRLTENIRQSQLYGDTGTRRAERAEIISGLNEIAVSVGDVSFNELCNPSSGQPTLQHNLTEHLDVPVESRGMGEVVSIVSRLKSLLQEEEVDLGKVQRIKKYLIEWEGHPASKTAVLFSHPAVVAPIQRAVEKLIGPSNDLK